MKNILGQPVGKDKGWEKSNQKENVYFVIIYLVRRG
jgi:hypothetical protein